MLVIMTVVMRIMIMAAMVMMTVICVVTMVNRRRRIGPALGIERRLDRGHARAEAREQYRDGRIAPQPQAVTQHLHRHVTVAEMPGELGEMHEVASADFEQRLGLDDNLHEAAALELERIAHPQRDGRRQIEDAAHAADRRRR